MVKQPARRGGVGAIEEERGDDTLTHDDAKQARFAEGRNTVTIRCFYLYFYLLFLSFIFFYLLSPVSLFPYSLFFPFFSVCLYASWCAQRVVVDG